jgi:hypothetical protein
VRLAALTCVVGGTVSHPLVAGLDDDTLRTQLLEMARRIVGLPEAVSPRRTDRKQKRASA